MSDEQTRETADGETPSESGQSMTEQTAPVRRKKKASSAAMPEDNTSSVTEDQAARPKKKRLQPKPTEGSGDTKETSAVKKKKKKRPSSEDGPAASAPASEKKKRPKQTAKKSEAQPDKTEDSATEIIEEASDKTKDVSAPDKPVKKKKKHPAPAADVSGSDSAEKAAADATPVKKKKKKRPANEGSGEKNHPRQKKASAESTAAPKKKKKKPASSDAAPKKPGTKKVANKVARKEPEKEPFRLSVPAPIQKVIDRRNKKKQIEADRLARISALREEYEAADPNNREDIREELAHALRVQKREERKRKEARKEHIIMALAAVVAVFLILLIVNRYHLTIQMPDGDAVSAQYGETYEDPEVTATYKGTIFHFRDADVDVDVSGTVNTDEEGSYELTYTASYRNKTVTAVRTVTVADTEAPVIELETDEESYTEPGTEYEEEGYTATDNYDGDLTDEVTSEERDGVVYYSVTDSHGNTGTAERTIHYDDNTAPVITLDSSVNRVLVDSDWEDSYSAYDDGDGDVTSRVTSEGTVDTSTEGTYTITYSVTDSYGNEATAERTVSVVYTLEDEVTGPNVIFLTFDDGPGPYTEELLDILAKYNVKATFFVTNQFPDYQDLIGREAEEGHTVAVHTYSHDFETVYTTDEGYWEDFDKMNDIIEEQTGERSTIFRFPGGSSNTVSRNYNEEEGIMTRLTQEAGEKGYEYFDWNVSSGDAGETTDSDEVYENIISQLDEHDVDVILVHDIHEYTVDCIEDVIVYALNNGYTFMPLSPGIYTCHHGVNN